MANIQKNVFNREIKEEKTSRRHKRLTRKRKVYRFIIGFFIFFLCLNLYTIAKRNIQDYIQDKRKEDLGTISYETPNETIKDNEKFSISFFSVGLGDSVLVSVGNTDVLINTGLEPYSEDLIKELDNKIKDNKIEYLYVTEMSMDMTGGLLPVIKHFKIGEYYHASDILYKDSNYSIFKGLIRKNGIKSELIDKQTIDLGSGVTISVMPVEKGNKVKRALITVAKDDKSFVYMGNLTITEEEEYRDMIITPSLYLYPEHGKKYREASSDMSIAYYIISCSNPNSNNETYPNKDVLENLRNKEQLITTYENGTITFTYREGEFVLNK